MLLVEFVDLDGDKVVVGRASGLAHGFLADGSEGLRDSICDSAEDGVGDHHGQD